MDIITFVLTENDARLIGQHGLNLLAALDTQQVMTEINCYIANPGADRQIVGMVRKAYAQSIGLAEAADNPELMAAIKTIELLRPSDITAEVPEEMLLQYRQAIDMFMECDFAVPYKSPVKTASFKDVAAALKEINPAVYKKVNRAKDIFTDPYNARSVGTTFKRSAYNTANLKIVKEGCDFLLEAGKHYSPVAWRHL